MGGILRNWRVLGAALVAMTVIGGSYLLARSVDAPSLAEASAETALLQSIATKDSSGDGLPDWQKVLYGIPLDATTTDYFHLGMTDGEAVAKGLIVPKAMPDISATSSDQGTLTESFGKAFFTLYLAAKQQNGGADLSPDQTNSLATEAFTQFIEHFASPVALKQSGDLKSGGTGADALASYAASAEAVFNRYQSKTPVNELQSIQDALQNNDPQALSALADAADIYRSYAQGLAALPVPTELASADLALVNAFYQRSSIYAGIATAKEDPLLAIVSVQQLTQNEIDWQKALADMGIVFETEGVSLGKGAPGAGFIQLAERLHQLNP